MTDSSYGAHTHRLAATFGGKGQAEKAAEVLSRNLRDASVEITSRRDDPHVQHAEMRDELEGMVASPVLGSALTKSQAQGGIAGILLIGGIATALGLIVGFMVNGAPGSEISSLRWFMTWAMIPAAAGGTLGLLAGGMLKQRYAPSDKDSVPDYEAGPDAGIESAEETVVEITTDDENELERALDILRDMNPERLDQFDAEGQVVATRDLGGRASN
ncbi:hypothetical protein BH23ACT12_BH23ACT12_08500 [soil metagenome]